MVLRVAAAPLALVLRAAECAFWANPGSFAVERHLLDCARAPVVVAALRVFGIADQAAEMPLAFHHHFVAINRHNRDKPARPVVLFQNLSAADQILRDFVSHRLAALRRRRHLRDQLRRCASFEQFHLELLQAIIVDHSAVRHLVNRGCYLLANPVFSDTNLVIKKPVAVVLIAIGA